MGFLGGGGGKDPKYLPKQPLGIRPQIIKHTEIQRVGKYPHSPLPLWTPENLLTCAFNINSFYHTLWLKGY